ncbi:transcriptional regulator [Klebsiella quasipneumoniae]|uniref:helix-turn-helix domain-containing protein n=1 Tax=Enterobacteriaceae TaxID=543 RepID=UPI0005F90783|nr:MULTISPECIES: helix-turn-helix transcriptional regulator [Enterobacteriaceae]KJW77599.1 transcriptional regulator [Enterobacter asburiae]KJW88659.1 transcriptional regulator [Enterobacter hormaechei subsp. steigerwaltii]KJX07371.1 transcriptional regulator [Enterobacter asburiae]KJX16123.1 transcriptional regulator [Enterobacter hormaechei subsp. xiangfangensis]PLG16294.1 transcriptional regulator [Klebsiella quasipneumoniae]
MPRRRDTDLEQEHDEKPVAAERFLFAKNFRKARIAAQMSQRDVKDKTGFAQSWVSEIETGKMSPTIDNMAKLAHCVGVPLWQLLVPS